MWKRSQIEYLHLMELMEVVKSIKSARTMTNRGGKIELQFRAMTMISSVFIYPTTKAEQRAVAM